MSQLVTGDAVVLGLQPAKLPSRALAIVLDLVVVVGLYLLLSVVLLSTVMPLGSAAAAAVQVGLLLLVVAGGPVMVETLSQGRSLGKLACGLRVVREDGGPIRFRHALVRGVVGFIEILLTFGSVACIASLISARGRRLGDVFGGTLVVRERIPGARMKALPPPPMESAGQYAGLDLSRVPDSLWLAIRQYLSRREQLDPRVGWSMAEQLANDLAERVGAPPPPEMRPDVYLAGVVGERQRRDAARAFGTTAAATPFGASAGAPAHPEAPTASAWAAPTGAPPVLSSAVGEEDQRPGVAAAPDTDSAPPRHSGFIPPS